MEQNSINKVLSLRDYNLFLAGICESGCELTKLLHSLIYEKSNQTVVFFELDKNHFNRLVSMLEKYNHIIDEHVELYNLTQDVLDIKFSGNKVKFVCGDDTKRLFGLGCNAMFISRQCITQELSKYLIPVLLSKNGYLVSLP